MKVIVTGPVRTSEVSRVGDGDLPPDGDGDRDGDAEAEAEGEDDAIGSRDMDGVADMLSSTSMVRTGLNSTSGVMIASGVIATSGEGVTNSSLSVVLGIRASKLTTAIVVGSSVISSISCDGLTAERVLIKEGEADGRTDAVGSCDREGNDEMLGIKIAVSIGVPAASGDTSTSGVVDSKASGESIAGGVPDAISPEVSIIEFDIVGSKPAARDGTSLFSAVGMAGGNETSGVAMAGPADAEVEISGDSSVGKNASGVAFPFDSNFCSGEVNGSAVDDSAVISGDSFASGDSTTRTLALALGDTTAGSLSLSSGGMVTGPVS